MDFRTEFPDYADIEKHVRQARLERSLYIGDAIARVIVAARDAVKSFLDREPLRDSRMQWRPDVPLPKRPLAQE
jgi:hypothetical protein